MPFGLTARQHNAWLLYGGGLDRTRALLADFGVVNLPGGTTGTQMGGWRRREITSLPTCAASRGASPASARR